MPKKSIDYSKTVIYKICCKDINITDFYVGHTTELTKRKYQHKTNCNNENFKAYNIYLYRFIRENGGWDNWEVVKIEDYICNSFNDALKRERFWIEELKATLNRTIPTRTDAEYYQDNKEKILIKRAIYREQNKEKLKEYFIEQNKAYREKNRDKINVKIECECGCLVSKSNIARHKKSKNHLEKNQFNLHSNSS